MAQETNNPRRTHDETEPLLGRQQTDGGEGGDSRDLLVSFTTDDKDNPRLWSRREKMLNVLVIAVMAVLSPLASSMVRLNASLQSYRSDILLRSSPPALIKLQRDSTRMLPLSSVALLAS